MSRSSKLPKRRRSDRPTKALRDLMRTPSVIEAAPSKTPGLDWIKSGKPYLPTDYNERKSIPIMTGLLDYFPLALIEVALVSVSGNARHNPGEDLHWARGKSMDQMNTALRHMMERGGRDTDGRYHLAKSIWRLCAELQIEIEKERGLPPSRASWIE